MSNRVYKIGSRASALARRQTQLVIDAINNFFKNSPNKPIFEIVLIQTTGDRILHSPLADIGGKALFTKEIQRSLLNREIDFAVHSLKDLEHTLPVGLTIAAVLEREDSRDALIINNTLNHKIVKNNDSTCLKHGARIGTCSPRRAAQLLQKRPDLKILPIRGNLLSRLQKLATGEYDGTILALAGLKRLNLWPNLDNSLVNDTLRGYPQFSLKILNHEEMIPSVGQGVIAIECRDGDSEVKELLSGVNHLATHTCIRAERSFLRGVGGNCHTAIAAWAKISVADNHLELRAVYFPNFCLKTMPDLKRVPQKKICLIRRGNSNFPEILGRELSLELKNSILLGNMLS